MRRGPFRLGVGILVTLLLAGAWPADPTTAAAPPRATERRLLADLGTDVRVMRDPASGRIRAVSGGRRALVTAVRLGRPTTPAAAADAFVSRYGSLLGVAAPARDLRRTRVGRTPRAGTYVRYQQRIGGVPVIGGDVVVVVDRALGVRAARGEVSTDRRVDTRARIGAGAAARLATAAVVRSSGTHGRALTSSQPERWILDPRLLDAPGLPFARLVWRTRVRDASGLVDQFVAVDAQTGDITLRFDQVRWGAPRDAVQRICDQMDLRENVRDRLPCSAAGAGSPPFGPAELGRAAVATEATFDFFWNRFGYDFPAGIEGANTGLLVSTARYCPRAADGPCPYPNAFWTGSQMVFGTGFAGADDVVGHELTHGVTELGSNLFYYMQSGAINEALSDIFGELIDQTNDHPFDDDRASVRWKIGEDIPSIGAVRDMEDPALYGHPDRMGSDRYDSDPAEVDGGGVHANSGVANRALVLMVDGGTLHGVTVPPLDADRDVAIDQAAALWFLAGQHLLTTASDHADLADALAIACDQLAGVPGGVRRGDGGASTAIDAVGDCGPDGTVARASEATQLRLVPPKAPVSRVRPCTDPAAPLDTLLFDPIDAAATGWTLDGGADPRWSVAAVYGYRDPAEPPGSTAATWHLFGWNAPTSGSGRVARATATAIPSGARPVFLWFRHAYGFDDGSEDLNPNDARYDGGVVEVRVGDGPWQDLGPLFIDGGYDGTIHAQDVNPLKGRAAFTAESHGYGASRAVLTGFPALDLSGSAARIGFRIGTDSSYGGEGWFIDDVRILRCGDTQDDTPPQVTSPSVALRRGTLGTDGRAPVRVAFSAEDPSGVALTRLDLALGAAAPASILPSAAARRVDLTLPAVTPVQHLVAGATDEQGNSIAAPATNVRLRLTQETGASFVGRWTTQRGSAFSDGAVRSTATKGRAATVSIAGARSVGFVTVRGPDRGKARVCVNGTGCRVLDLYSPTLHPRRLAAVWSYPGAATRTVTITVLGKKRAASSGKRVDLDAIVAVRG